nr:MAG TPA: hypothetical protein [Caudoviricetes sp.]
MVSRFYFVISRGYGPRMESILYLPFFFYFCVAFTTTPGIEPGAPTQGSNKLGESARTFLIV